MKTKKVNKTGRIMEYMLEYANTESTAHKGQNKEYEIAAQIVERATTGDPKAVDLYVKLTGQAERAKLDDMSRALADSWGE